MTGHRIEREGRAFHCLPKREAGATMPTAYTIDHSDTNRRKEAEMGCERLFTAIERYLEKLHRERVR